MGYASAFSHSNTMKIDYSASFSQQFYQQFDYWQKQIGTAAAERLLQELIERFEHLLQPFPQGYRVCAEAATLGFTDYYEFIAGDRNVRIIYRLSDQPAQRAVALLFLRTQQCLRDQLIELVLMRP